MTDEFKTMCWAMLTMFVIMPSVAIGGGFMIGPVVNGTANLINLNKTK